MDIYIYIYIYIYPHIYINLTTHAPPGRLSQGLRRRPAKSPPDRNIAARGFNVAWSWI